MSNNPKPGPPRQPTPQPPATNRHTATNRPARNVATACRQQAGGGENAKALGPYGKRVVLNDLEELDSANAILIMRRIAFSSFDDQGKSQASSERDNRKAVLQWATRTSLGQEGNTKLRIASAARRGAAARQLGQSAGSNTEQWRTITFFIEPEWRLAIGLGDKGGVSEIGLSLHGTYGFPIIPGSSLKGLVRHWANQQPDIGKEEIQRILGDSLNEKEQENGSGSESKAKSGSVIFFDAIPSGDGHVGVVEDVLTPHNMPYYERHATAEARMKGGESAPPAGWNNPIPSAFLTLRGEPGSFLTCISGPEDAVGDAFTWLKRCIVTEGIGAKTAAGYGYVHIKELKE